MCGELWLCLSSAFYFAEYAIIHYISLDMKTLSHIADGQLVTSTDIRSIINGEGRPEALNILAASLEATLVRAPNGLSLCLTDKSGGAVIAMDRLEDVLANSLAAGSLVENALDNLPMAEALGEVRAGLQRLIDVIDHNLEFSGGADTTFDFEELPPRDPAVEAEVELELASVG